MSPAGEDPVVLAKRERVAEPSYRSFAEFTDKGGTLAEIRSQVSTWLIERGLDVDLESSGVTSGEKSELLVIAERTRDEQILRVRLLEANSAGNWRSELTVSVSNQRPSWFLLEVSNDRGRFVDVPRLARYLLTAIEARDGDEFPITASARKIGAGEVEELAEAVTDPARNGLLFVAGTNEYGLDFDDFVRQVARWTRQTVGQAETVVLDPPATLLFKEIMEQTHGVLPWTIRTYLPDVDPAVATDALRHRFLTTQRLATSHERDIERLLGRIARRHVGNRALPRRIIAAGRRLSRLENSLLVDAVSLAESINPESTRSSDTVLVSPVRDLDESKRLDLVRAVLGIDPTDEVALRRYASERVKPKDAAALQRVTQQLSRQQDRIEVLQAERDAALSALDDEQLEHEITQSFRRELIDQVAFMSTRLKDLRDWEGAAGVTPTGLVTKYPDSFMELLEWMPNLSNSGVDFTGDPKLTATLDAHDTLGKAARAAWESMLVLADYLRAREAGDWNAGVDGYLAQTPSGYRSISPGKHAETETGSTMRRFGAERTFVVPAECDSNEAIIMKAHFKLGRIGMVSPRLHYYDAYSRTGRAYVGYIGPHLTNTQSK